MEKLEKVVIRQCMWMKDFLEVKGDFKISKVFVKDEIDELDLAPTSIKPYIDEIEPGSNWQEEWAFRAVSIAAKVLDDSALKDYEEKMKGIYTDKRYMVDWQGNYAV